MGTKLSDLPEATSMGNTDILIGVIGGVTKKIQRTNLLVGATATSAINAGTYLDDGSTYSRIIKVYADAINNGSYNLMYDGVSWNETTDAYTRVGRTSGSPNYLAVQNKMRRCVVADDGTVAYYLHPTNSYLKEDGSTASVLTGADGQVMVEIPKFYYSYSYDSPTTTHTWKISELPLPGFELHPLFLQGTTELSGAYIGAYEASVYDVSATKYMGGAGIYQTVCQFIASTKTILCSGLTAPFANVVAGNVFEVTGTVSNNTTVLTVVSSTAQSIVVSESITDETSPTATSILLKIDTTATTGDKLASVDGYAPVTFKTRANYRTLGKNRGTGWTQQTFEMVTAVQLLYLTEYLSFYSQSKIGAGITGVTSGWPAYNNYFPIAKSGNSNVIGNATGNTAGSSSAATETTKYLSYRGIENFFGHIWKWVDGININTNVAYKTNAITSFADDTTTGYSVIGTLANADGWQNTLLPVKGGFLPKTVGGTASGSVKITDYYYQASGWRVVLLGGLSTSGAFAGFFSWSCYHSSAAASQHFGARLGLLKS